MESNGITHYVPKSKGNYGVHCWLSTCKSQGAKTAVHTKGDNTVDLD